MNKIKFFPVLGMLMGIIFSVLLCTGNIKLIFIWGVVGICLGIISYIYLTVKENTAATASIKQRIFSGIFRFVLKSRG